MEPKSIEEIIAAIMANHPDPASTTSCSPIRHDCELCQDTGWVQFERDGYTFSRECDCVKARKAKRLMENSGLKEALRQQTMEAFVTENDAQKQIKEMAQQYLEAFFSAPSDEPRRPWLYIGGNPGCGKTHICTAICGELLRANVEVVYMQWLSETRRLKAYTNEPDFDRLLDKFVDCEVLYIDDLYKQTYTGSPILTDADVRMGFTIFNARYLQNKPTIISSEWALSDLLDADEGVFSRVYERCKGFTLTVPRDMKYNYRLARLRA